MAYEMHEWVCNEPITADKLNHMEQGIVEAQNDESSGSDVLIIRQDGEASTASRIVYDKTWQQVYDALQNGTRVIFLQETDLPPTVIASFVVSATNDTSNSVAPYQVLATEVTSAAVGTGTMYADTADGYLYQNLGGGGGNQ